MKIDSHHPAREVHGSGGHHAHKAKHAEKAAATSTTATAATEQAGTTVSLTSEAAAAADAAPQTTDSGRKVPPGLARVAARFESLGEAGRTRGQSNALAQIQRNLQRYADVQELAPPASSPGSTTPVTPTTDPTIAAPTDPIAVPVDGVAGGSAAADAAAGNGAVGDTAVAVGEDAASTEPVPAN